MHPGGCTTQSPGATRDHILYTKLDAIGGSIRLRAYPLTAYQEKYYALYVNGTYEGFNRYANPNEIIQTVSPLDPGTTAASAYLEDCGDWSAFPDGFSPDGQAETNDATSAQRIQFVWTAPYSLTSVRGDTQLSAITVTGAIRNVNVQRSNRNTRGILSYTISNSGGTYTVSWYNGDALVAQGSRAGNGAVSCAEQNNSGLAVACTITYTADVAADTAYLELRWPESYAVHYSTTALSFPRAAEETVNDSGLNDFEHLTPVLAAGTYYWNILTVDDDGITQSAGFATTTTLQINTTPASPTITGVTGTAAALTVNWTVGEAGCTFTAYHSYIDGVTNFGQYLGPAAVTTAADATSAILPAVTGYPGYVRVVVRATKSSNQETADAVYEVELDAAGAIVNPRPNRASITGITITGGLTLSVEGIVVDDDAQAAATAFDLLIVALAGSIDPTAAAQATVALGDAVLGVKRGTVPYTVLAGGWYRMALLAKTAALARSKQYAEYIIYIDNTAPGVVPTLSAKVLRGK